MTSENLIRITKDYSHIFFDLDDTIYPISDFDNGAFLTISKKFLDPSMIEIGREWLIKNKNVIIGNRLFLSFLNQFELSLDFENACIDTYQNYDCESLDKKNSLYQLIYDLKKSGRFLFLLTNGNYMRQERKIQALGLRELFDGIAIGDPLVSKELMKPNINILKYLGVDPFCNKCIMVGDNDVIDGGFAKNVNIDYVKFKFPI